MTTASKPLENGEETRTSAPAKGRAKPYMILTTIVGAGACLYLLFNWYTQGKQSTDDAQVEADVVPISARVSGAVLKVYVHDNQPVKKGDPLVEIDPADLAAKAKQAEAELEAARAQATAADAQVRIVEATSKGGLSAARAQLTGSASSVGSADAQIQSAKAAVARAEAEAQKATNDLGRAEALRKDDAIPQAQVDTLRATAAASKAAVAQAQAQLAVAEDMRRTAQTRVSEAQAHVEQSTPIDAQLASARANADLAHARMSSADAAVALAKLQLSYTRIEAPADGVLAKLAVREGQLVQPGQPIVSLVPNATYLIANFKETQVGQMRSGQHAMVEIDAFPGRKFDGIVESTAPGTGARFSLLPPDNASGNFVKVVQRVPVKIAWDKLPSDVKLSAGMSADVTVLTK